MAVSIWIRSSTIGFECIFNFRFSRYDHGDIILNYYISMIWPTVYLHDVTYYISMIWPTAFYIFWFLDVVWLASLEEFANVRRTSEITEVRKTIVKFSWKAKTNKNRKFDWKDCIVEELINGQQSFLNIENRCSDCMKHEQHHVVLLLFVNWNAKKLIQHHQMTKY